MDVFPLVPPDLAGIQARGDARALLRGRTPRTIGEILRDAATDMAEQDALEEYQRDPVAWITAERRKHSLWGRLMHGRGRRSVAERLVFTGREVAQERS